MEHDPWQFVSCIAASGCGIFNNRACLKNYRKREDKIMNISLLEPIGVPVETIQAFGENRNPRTEHRPARGKFLQENVFSCLPVCLQCCKPDVFWPFHRSPDIRRRW